VASLWIRYSLVRPSLALVVGPYVSAHLPGGARITTAAKFDPVRFIIADPKLHDMNKPTIAATHFVALHDRKHPPAPLAINRFFLSVFHQLSIQRSSLGTLIRTLAAL
jgi:hypothetical protein